MDRGARESLQNQAGLRVYFYLESLGEEKKKKGEKKEIQVTDHRQNRVLTEELGTSSPGNPIPLWKELECRSWDGPRGICVDLGFPLHLSRRLNGLWALQENHFR